MSSGDHIFTGAPGSAAEWYMVDELAKEPFFKVKNEERVTLYAQKRVNKATLASRPLEAIKDDLTHHFASTLVRELMQAGLLRVSSEVSKATGAVTFTAELVCLKEEKQNNATTTKTTKDSSD
jgi:hypothetical protein